MVLRSTRAVVRPGSSSAQYVKRIPADLKKIAPGKSLRIALPSLEQGGDDDVVLVNARQSVIAFSLRVPASHPRHKLRLAAADAQILAWFEALRRGPEKLSHKQLTAVAAEAYRIMADTLSNEPVLTAAQWERIAQDQIRDLEENPLLIGVAARAEDRDARLEARYGILTDAILRRLSIITTADDRMEIIRRVARHMPQATLRISRAADDDFSEDAYAQRLPSSDVLRKPQERRSKPSLSWDGLLANWRKVRRPSDTTYRDWTKIARSFAAHCGKDDVSLVDRDDVRRYRDYLQTERGLKIKGINDTQLAALKAFFNAAIREGLLEDNPATQTSLTDKSAASEKMTGFTDADVRVLLQAAMKEDQALFRWAPLLMAQSGARVGEVCQLRGSDFQSEGPTTFFWIQARVKTGQRRRVPVHPELVRLGLLELVQVRGEAPLFYDPAIRRAVLPEKVLVKDLGKWVSSTGIKVGRIEHRKDPNHAWRHWLITMLRRLGVEGYVIKAIVGHRGGDVTSGYGETPLKTMAKALQKVPLGDLISDRPLSEIGSDDGDD